MQFQHSNLFEDNSSLITNFKQDKTHRKCYITSNKGQILELNIINAKVLNSFASKQLTEGSIAPKLNDLCLNYDETKDFK